MTRERRLERLARKVAVAEERLRDIPPKAPPGHRAGVEADLDSFGWALTELAGADAPAYLDHARAAFARDRRGR